MLQFLPGHVRFCPAVWGDRSFVCLRPIVDDGPNQLKVTVVTAANHGYSTSWLGEHTVSKHATAEEGRAGCPAFPWSCEKAYTRYVANKARWPASRSRFPSLARRGYFTSTFTRI